MPNENIDSKRHIITIANFNDGNKGRADMNGIEMWLDVSLLSNSPSNSVTGLCETCTNGTQNTLERTSAHEFGHNAALGEGHNLVGNIMVQSNGEFPGMKVNNDQLNTMINISSWRNGASNNSERGRNNSDALQGRKY